VYYLNTVFYNIICREEGIGKKKAQWIYVSQGDSLISRITCMKEFAPYSCPAGYYNIICELTDSQQKPCMFLHPERYLDQLLAELKGMKFLKDLKAVEAIKINPVQDTYPIYHKRYLADFLNAAEAVRYFSSRIHLLGRSGAFWYNNSDHSIRFAIELVQWLLGDQEKAFNYRDYFGGEAKAAPDSFHPLLAQSAG
jgi:protoporphyrinogen oxidase